MEWKERGFLSFVYAAPAGISGTRNSPRIFFRVAFFAWRKVWVSGSCAPAGAYKGVHCSAGYIFFTIQGGTD